MKTKFNFSRKRIILLIAFLLLMIYPAWKLKAILEELIRYSAFKNNLPELPAVHQSRAIQGRVFSEKIWLHRVNSIERAKIMSEKYTGLELDITYDSRLDYFDVGHPPSPSIGLSLDQYFASIPDAGSHYFWLDFKNLDDSTKHAACVHLVKLADKYNFRKQLIIESNKSLALDVFSAAGFYIAYYVPVFRPETADVKDIEKYYTEMKTVLEKSSVNAISGPSYMLPFFEKYFPDHDLLLWHLDDRRGIQFYATISFLRMKEKVKVILVNQDSPGFR